MKRPNALLLKSWGNSGINNQGGGGNPSPFTNEFSLRHHITAIPYTPNTYMPIQPTTKHQNPNSKTTAVEFFRELNALKDKYPMCYVEAWTPDDFEVTLGSTKLTNEKHLHYIIVSLAKQGTLAGILSPTSQEWETIADWHSPQHPLSVDCISTSQDAEEGRDRIRQCLFEFEELTDEDVVDNGLQMYRSHLDGNRETIIVGEDQ